MFRLTYSHPTISAKSVSQMYDAETVAFASIMIWSLPRLI